MDILKTICAGIPSILPPAKKRDFSVPHAPTRTPDLNLHEKQLAIQNALRYFEPKFHNELAVEFFQELEEFGHIYMYRFRPNIEMRAYPIEAYPAKCKQAAAIMLMIMNNLDPKVAQFPHELVTYGGNGQVFSNWIQFLLVMHYLSEINEDQTLVMYSGHPLGVFPSNSDSPLLVITNGMMIPNYSSREKYDKLFALGVTMYGQMTAGSYCYIGPQGIVHGTTLTIKNAGRKYLHLDDLTGKVFVSSGLGGMSGAQAKAAIISGCIGVIAEVNQDALYKRLAQGWLSEVTTTVDQCIERIRHAKHNKEAISIGYLGNVVDLWKRIVEEFEKTGELLVELGSDQTSCHNPFNGGYYPYQLSVKEAEEMMKHDPLKFKELVQESLQQHIAAINTLSCHGMFFWDYGNAFLLEAQKAGADVSYENPCDNRQFKYPSYIQDIMGDIFSLGFGPFRWVCTSGCPEDLKLTDIMATEVLQHIVQYEKISEATKQQYNDNIHWIKEAGQHQMVVGSQARILYSDQQGRVAIAKKFNEAVRNKILKGPVVISRDHHDVSGTDSPFRETSNIYDGSAFCADMAVQNVIGDAFRGATWVALHNGGGVGWGEVINGGFGMLLDGSERASKSAESMLTWDVLNGVARRCWSGNAYAEETISQAIKNISNLRITMPYKVDQSLMNKLFS